MEQYVLRAKGKGKSHHQEDVCVEFCKEKEPLYLKTNVSGVGLGAGLLQVLESLRFPQDEALDSTVLQSVAFARRSLTNKETMYGNIEREALGKVHRLEKILPLLLHL